MPDQTVIEQAAELRKKLSKNDAETIRKLTVAYQGVLYRLQSDIEALVSRIGEDQPTEAELKKLGQYRRLIEDIKGEVNRYGGYLSTEMSTGAREMITQGQAASKLLVMANITQRQAEIMATYRTLNPAAIENLLGFLKPDGALYKKVELLEGYTAELVSQRILSGVAMGKNPKIIAKDIQNALGGGLTQALRMSVTVQSWSYREASRASYMANSHIVKGWYWMADLPGNPCASCVAMHGTFHETSEILDDHYNGRCAALPATITNPGNPLEDGEKWFNRQPENVQRSIMTASKLEAYKSGKFQFSQLSQQSEDTVYGMMRVETPLKDLLND